jgi:hypothetical protein
MAKSLLSRTAAAIHYQKPASGKSFTKRVNLWPHDKYGVPQGVCTAARQLTSSDGSLHAASEHTNRRPRSSGTAGSVYDHSGLISQLPADPCRMETHACSVSGAAAPDLGHCATPRQGQALCTHREHITSHTGRSSVAEGLGMRASISGKQACSGELHGGIQRANESQQHSWASERQSGLIRRPASPPASVISITAAGPSQVCLHVFRLTMSHLLALPTIISA